VEGLDHSVEIVEAASASLAEGLLFLFAVTQVNAVVRSELDYLLLFPATALGIFVTSKLSLQFSKFITVADRVSVLVSNQQAEPRPPAYLFAACRHVSSLNPQQGVMFRCVPLKPGK
jgi:hypothetical protein